MRILCFGGGDLADAFGRALRFKLDPWDEYIVLGKGKCDVRDFHAVLSQVDRIRPDFIVCTAGRSDRLIGTNVQEVIDVNLKGAIYVSLAAGTRDLPTLLIGSTAGMQAPVDHPVYGPAKAGVIAHVAAAGKAGKPVYCLSPNRMNTRMREADWPGEDPATRLDPKGDVAPVMIDIMEQKYPRGANVVVRKVGFSPGRVDVFQAPTLDMPGML